MKKRVAKAFLVQESYLNSLGYQLLPVDRKKATGIFELNVESNPESADACDSLAETYLADGRKQLATQYYERALKLEPNYPNAKNAAEILAKFKAEK